MFLVRLSRPVSLYMFHSIPHQFHGHNQTCLGIILGMSSANGRWRYILISSLIGHGRTTGFVWPRPLEIICMQPDSKGIAKTMVGLLEIRSNPSHWQFFQIWWKIYFTKIQFLVIILLQMFAHATAAVLQWHAQKFAAISAWKFWWKHENKIHFKSNLGYDEKNYKCNVSLL